MDARIRDEQDDDARELLRIKPADFVSAFARGLDVIRAFDFDTPSLTVSSAAERTGMSRAAVRRFLLTLKELGYASDEGDTFFLRPKIMEIGHTYLSTWNMAQRVTPHLREGVRLMDENVSFGILEEDQAVYLARAEARRLVHSIVMAIGSRVPAVLSAMGRVLLANQSEEAIAGVLDGRPLPRNTASSRTDPAELREILDEVREKGWCFVAGEFEHGVLSLAVPIADANGRVIAAINVGAPTTRIGSDEMIERFLPVMLRLGRDISAGFAAEHRLT